MTESTNASASAGATAQSAPAGAPVAQAPGDAAGSGARTQGGSAQKARGYRKTRRGYVVSDKMQKTVVVEVEDRVKHPLYGKVLRRSSKVKAHDEAGVAGIGDLVLITETRPLSATKRWRVVEILERAK
jgi:small subunit ribosomal protein S17